MPCGAIQYTLVPILKEISRVTDEEPKLFEESRTYRLHFTSASKQYTNILLYGVKATLGWDIFQVLVKYVYVKNSFLQSFEDQPWEVVLPLIHVSRVGATEK